MRGRQKDEPRTVRVPLLAGVKDYLQIKNTVRCNERSQAFGFLQVTLKIRVYVCLIARELINRCAPNLACLSFETGKRMPTCLNFWKKISWVWIPVKVVFVDRKISSVGWQHKSQSCSFRRKDLGGKKKNWGHTSENSWVRLLVK